MNEEKITLFTVEIDDEKAQKNIVELKKSTEDYKKIQQDLTKSYKDGEISRDKYISQNELIEQQIKRNTKEIQENRKVVENVKKANDTASGSILEMRANLSLATAAYNALSKEQRENAEVGGKLAEYVRDLSDNLKTEEEIIGNHTRSVGDYAKALREGSIRSVNMGKSLADLDEDLKIAKAAWDALTEEERKNEEIGGVVANQIKQVSDEIEDQNKKLGDYNKTAKDYIKGLSLGGVSVEELGEAFEKGTKGVQVFTKGITASRGAMIAFTAIPIIAVLVAVVALITKSQAGMDKLAQYTKAASLAFDALTKGLIEMGRTVIDAFTSWEKFTNLFSKLGDQSRELGSSMLAAAKAGAEIEKVNQQIEAAEIALSVRNAKNRADIEKNKKLSEDVTKSEVVRRTAAKKAYDIENQGLQESLKLQRLKINNYIEELKYKERTREEDKKLAELQIEAYNLEEDSVGRQTELQNQLNQIEEEARQKAEEARKKRAEDIVAEVQVRLINAKKLSKDTFEIEKELLKRQSEAELIDRNKTANQRRLIAAKLSSDLYTLEVNRAAEAVAAANQITISGINASLVFVEKGSEAEQQLIEAKIRAESYARAKAIEQRLKGEEKAVQRGIELAEETATAQAQIDASRAQQKQTRIQKESDAEERRIQTEMALDEMSYLRWASFEKRRIDESEKTQIALLEIERKANLISEAEYLNRLNLIQAQAIEQRRELGIKLQQEDIARQKVTLDKQLAQVKEGTAKEFRIRLELIENERKAKLAAAKKNQAEIDKINAESDKQRNDTTTAFELDQSQRITEQVSRANALLSNIFEASIAASTANLEKQQASFVKSAGNNALLRGKIEEQFAKKREALDKEAARKRQKIASVEAVISIAQGIIEAVKQPFPYNIIQGALVAATGAAQLAVINAQKFARGGYYRSDNKGAFLQYGPGTSTSDSINSKLSVGETVINARSTEKHFDLLSAINEDGGGVKFAGAKSVNIPTTAPGYKYGTVGFGYQDSATLVDTIAEAFSNAQPVLVLEDVNQLQQQQNRTKVRTTIKTS